MEIKGSEGATAERERERERERVREAERHNPTVDCTILLVRF